MVSLRLETRAQILAAFEEIPAKLIEAVRASEPFPDELDLCQAVTRLCDTLVKSTRTLIQILLRSHPQKHRCKGSPPPASPCAPVVRAAANLLQ